MSNQINDITVNVTAGTLVLEATQAGSATSPAIWQLVDDSKPSYVLPYMSFLASRKASNAQPASKDKGSLLLHVPNVDAEGLVTSTTTFQVVSHIPRNVSQATATAQFEILTKLLADAAVKNALISVVTPH